MFASLVDFFKIINKRGKIIQHGLGGNLFTQLFLHQLPPIDAGARLQNTFKESAYFLAAVVICGAWILLKNLGRDVVVELKKDDVRECVIVILRCIVVDVRFRSRIANSSPREVGATIPWFAFLISHQR